jgi:hypothetical protein
MTTSVPDRSVAQRTDRAGRAARLVAGLAGAVFAAFGTWAFAAPRSFFDAVATFEPYNAHFVRDIGAFQLGLGAVLLLALVWRDALSVVLVGVGVGATLHLLGHVLDRDLGGTPATDIPFFAVVAVALVAAGVARARARPQGRDAD